MADQLHRSNASAAVFYCAQQAGGEWQQQWPAVAMAGPWLSGQQRRFIGLESPQRAVSVWPEWAWWRVQCGGRPTVIVVIVPWPAEEGTCQRLAWLHCAGDSPSAGSVRRHVL